MHYYSTTQIPENNWNFSWNYIAKTEYDFMSCMNTVSVGNQIKFDWRISEKWQFHVQFHEKIFFFILSCFFFLRSKCTNCLSDTIMIRRPPFQCPPKIFYVIHLNNKQFTLVNLRFIQKLEKDCLQRGTVFDSAYFFYPVQIMVFWKIIIKNCVWGNIISKIRDDRGSKIK